MDFLDKIKLNGSTETSKEILVDEYDAKKSALNSLLGGKLAFNNLGPGDLDIVNLFHSQKATYGTLANVLPSLGHQYDVILATDHDKIESEDISAVGLFFVTDISVPKVGFQFSSSNGDFGFVSSAIQAGQNVIISYWDTKMLSWTKVIENVYRRQLATSGLLKINYRRSKIIIKSNGWVMELAEAAISRPVPSRFSAESNGLQIYTFEVAYQLPKVGFEK